MILLDANVVSAMMRTPLDHAVQAWLDRQEEERLFVSSPVIFEIQFGIASLPQGKRRRALEIAFDDLIAKHLDYRVASFDGAAAMAAGKARARLRKRGVTSSLPDSQVAGIALSCRAAIATRDTADYVGLGLTIINPWAA